MYLVDDNEEAVDAEFSFAFFSGRFSIIVESSGGGSATSKRRNPEYNKLVGILLDRIKLANAEVLGIYLESSRYHLVPENDRLLDLGIGYPFKLDGYDTKVIRKSIGRSLAKLLQEPGVTSNGNAQKRFRIDLGRRLSTEEVVAPSGFSNDSTQAVLNAFVAKSTTGEQLIKARKGQGAFRQQLLQRYNSACVLTQVSDPAFLVASHMKPWSESTDEERLDVENGLLLFTAHDRAFDQGFITLDEQGIVVFSQKLDGSVVRQLSAAPLKRVVLSQKQQEYLEYHRKCVYQI